MEEGPWRCVQNSVFPEYTCVLYGGWSLDLGHGMDLPHLHHFGLSEYRMETAHLRSMRDQPGSIRHSQWYCDVTRPQVLRHHRLELLSDSFGICTASLLHSDNPTRAFLGLADRLCSQIQLQDNAASGGRLVPSKWYPLLRRRLQRLHDA